LRPAPSCDQSDRRPFLPLSQDPPPYLGKGYSTPGGYGQVAKRWAWSIIEATLFRFSPRPFHGWRARLLKLFGAQIANPGSVVVFPTVRVTYPENLTLEDRAMIGPGVRLYNLGPITLQYGANISQFCHLCSGTHDFNRWDMPLVTDPILVGKNVWIAADVFIGPGVTIGDLAVVGARSVVVGDLPASHVCVGHPCRPIKTRDNPVTPESPPS